MESVRVRIGSNGRFVIPSEVRKALGVREGDELVVRLVDGEMRVSTAEAALRHARALVRKYVPRDASLVEELIEERRADADREP